MKNPFMTYTAAKAEHVENMKSTIGAIHLAFKNKDGESYRRAVGELAAMYATVCKSQDSIDVWNKAAQLAPKSTDVEYLSKTTEVLEEVIGAYAYQLEICYQRMITGADKFDVAMGFEGLKD